MAQESFVGVTQLGSERIQTQGKERGMITETEGDKAQRLLTSLALDTKRKYESASKDDQGKASELEKSFVALGKVLDAKMYPDIRSVDTAEPAYNFTKDFGEQEPKPRIRILPGNPNQFQPAFDEARSLTAGQSTPLEPNIYEIRSVYGRTRSDTGTTFYICYADTLDQTTGARVTEKFTVEEKVFIESYLVAQHSHLQAHLTDSTHINARLRENNVNQLLTSLTTEAATHAAKSKTQPDAILSLGSATDKAILDSEAGSKLRPSKDVVQGLAERMKKHVEKDTTRTAEAATLQKYIDAIATQGDDPGPEAILQILQIAGKPDLQNRNQEIGTRIKEIDKLLTEPKTLEAERSELRAEKAQLQRERGVLDSVLAGDTNNTVFELFQDIHDGRASAELVALLNGKLDSVDDPKAFFSLSVDDLANKSSLASVLLRHFGESKGLTEEQMNEKIVWLQKFLQEHGSDIAMMGIFALFQMMTGIISDAARGATH